MIWALTPVTIDVPCPPAPEPVVPDIHLPPIMFGTAVPSWVVGWGIVIVIGVILAIFITIWTKMNQPGWKPREVRRLEEKQAILNAKVAIAKAHNNCQNCGVTYAPKLEDIKT